VDTTLFGSNITFGNETRINATNIAFSGIVVGATDQVRLLVVFRLNLSASVSANLSANVSAAANIGANQTVNGNNFPIEFESDEFLQKLTKFKAVIIITTFLKLGKFNLPLS